MSEMQVVDGTGHTTHAWDPEIPSEVEAARAVFDSMTQNNRYRAFRVGARGQQGARMDKFDPKAEQMVLVPHVQGG